MPFRLAIVTSHPIQYHAPWFRSLSRAVDLEVLYSHQQDAAGQAAAGFGHEFDWDLPLLDGYQYRWLTNVARTPSVDTYAGCDTPQVGDVLDAGGYDACLVTGWYLKSSVQAIRACWRSQRPVLVRGDSQLATPRSWMVQAAKYVPYRWLLPKIDAHLYVGRANYEYLRYYGVASDRLFFVPHFVDNERFRDGAAVARQDGSAAALREAVGAGPGSVVFQFAGKLIPKKRPLDFLRALARLVEDGLDARALVIGSGPLEHELQQFVTSRSLPVRFLGFQNQRDMPRCYAAADCLVLPSDGGETWGLVVNEAMACGRPAIVSAAAGCSRDLVHEGDTGATYVCGDIAGLADRMRAMMKQLSQDPSRFLSGLTGMMACYSVDRAVAGTLMALQAVTQRE